MFRPGIQRSSDVGRAMAHVRGAKEHLRRPAAQIGSTTLCTRDRWRGETRNRKRETAEAGATASLLASGAMKKGARQGGSRFIGGLPGLAAIRRPSKRAVGAGSPIAERYAARTSRRQRRTGALVSSWLAVVMLTALLGAAPANASQQAVVGGDPGVLATAIGESWAAVQRPDGSYPDPVQGATFTCYGDSMLGYGVLAAGTRTGRLGLVRSGLRATRWALTHAKRGCAADRTFELLALGASYRLAVREAATHPTYKRIADAWGNWLRAQEASWLYRSGYYNNRYLWDLRFAQLPGAGRNWLQRVRAVRERPGFYNKQLVDALAVLELVRSGLSSRSHGAIVGSGQRRAVRAARRLILRTIPTLVPDLKRAYLLSDDPAYPPAYHAQDLALYARAITLLRPAASSPAVSTLLAGARATIAIAAPNGSVAYWGRSQEQSWTLSATAYAARVAAGYADPQTGRTLNSLARRSLGALTRYGFGPFGLDIVPALGEDATVGTRALDPWAGAPQYAGETLVYLEWGERLPAIGAEAERASTEQDRAVRVGRGSGRFVVVRRGPVWYAIKQLPTVTGDMRYDAGLVAASRLSEAGWVEVAPIRPRTVGNPSVHSVGPVLVADGRRGIPVATRARFTSDGGVKMLVNFRSLSGHWLRRDVPLTWKPVDCGVSLELAAEPGDRYEYAAFFLGDAGPAVDSAPATGMAGPDLVVTPSAARLGATVQAGRVTTGLASSANSQVAQQVFLIGASGSTITITHCDAL